MVVNPEDGRQPLADMRLVSIEQQVAQEQVALLRRKASVLTSLTSLKAVSTSPGWASIRKDWGEPAATTDKLTRMPLMSIPAKATTICWRG